MKKTPTASLLAMALLGGTAQAATTNFTWTGASSGLFSTAGNWLIDQPAPGTAAPRAPSANAGDDLAVFQGGVSVRTIDLAATARNVRGLRFDNVAGANGFTFNLSGLTTSTSSFGFNLRPDGIVNNDTDTQTFNTAIRLFTYAGGAPNLTITNTFNAAAGNLNFTGTWTSGTNAKPVIDLNGGTLQITGNADVTIGSAGNAGILGSGIGASSGAGRLIKDGNGTLNLNGTSANTYNSGTIINAGTVNANKANALGNAGALTITGGTLNIGANNQSVGAFSMTGGSVSGSSGVITASAYNFQAGTVSAILGGGSAALTKTGAGTTILNSANTYGGGTVVSNGTLRVHNTTGSGTGSGAVNLWGGTLAGNGTISGPVTVNATATIAATGAGGVGPGTLTTGNQTWKSAAFAKININQAGGTAGGSSGWSKITINGGLDIQAVPGDTFTIVLASLDALNAAGNVGDFNNSLGYDWLIASTTLGITGFDSSAFTIDTSNFSNNLGGGSFNLELQNSDKDLHLVFTPTVVPEPSSMVLSALGGVGVLLLVRRKKN